MIKNKKTDKLFLKLKSKYRIIFENKNLKAICNKHFDTKMGFIGFVIGLVINQLGEKKAFKHVQINSDSWIKVLSDIYDDKNITNAYEKLVLNPIISLEKIEKYFDCFDVVINELILYFQSEQLSLNIQEPHLRYLLKCCFGYIMYNCIDCRIPYQLKDILCDKEYEQKFIIITNNTKLFAKAKNAILSNCLLKISDLISLLLGISRELNYDK